MSDEEELEPQHRTAEQIARRCLALLVVIEHSYSKPDEQLPELARQLIPHAELSPEERSFLADIDPPENHRNTLSWRAEALLGLLWALGHVDSVYPLNVRVNLAEIPAILDAFKHPAGFVALARCRPTAELDEMEGDIYHQHWRVRDAQLFDREMPPDLDPDVVYERRYGLSWVVGFGDDWDNVPTDT